ncbi:hypothetical protein [Halobacillus sp. Marseille-Q1614]|uniref:hypothetical protein n=1 Tax=Halobacillus sp. Marseille-Q1614 TaxID=2709134 RepID=UPI0015710E4B|nr:hypothetical protein [Halobacillus sp. Marseille-Q1614]
MRYSILYTQLDEEGMRSIHILDRAYNFGFLYYTNEILDIPDRDMQRLLLNDWMNIIKGKYDRELNVEMIECFQEYHLN